MKMIGRIVFIAAAFFAGSTVCAQDDIAALTAAAEKGDTKAQYKLATDYHFASGVKKDDGALQRWMRKSAEQGYAPAEYVLGMMYGYGRGAVLDKAEGLKWITKAADDGNPNAKFWLGVLYETAGLDISQDHDKANTLFAQSIAPVKAAAESGDFEAESNLIVAYERGLGMPKDLGQSFQWRLKAAQEGSPPGEAYLGHAYMDGLGTAKNPVEAIKWFRKAADHGIDIAQYELGWCYFKRVGVPKDPVKAYMWFDIALVQGNKQAGQGMMSIVRDMKPEQIKEAMKLSHDWQAEHLAQPGGTP